MRRHFRASISTTAAFAVCPKPPTCVHIRAPSKRSRLRVLGSPNLTQPPEAEQQSHIPSDSHHTPLLLFTRPFSATAEFFTLLILPPSSENRSRYLSGFIPSPHPSPYLCATLLEAARHKEGAGLDAGIPRAQLTSVTAIRLMSGGFSDNLGPTRAPGNN